MNRVFEHEGQRLSLTVETQSKDGEWETLSVRLAEGEERTFQARRLPDGDIEIRQGDRLFRVPMAPGERGALSLAWQGAAYSFTPARPGRTQGKAEQGSGTLIAPMTGVIASILVNVGDKVTAYQPVVVVEAMKVLATIEAPFEGTVRSIHVEKGDRIEHGAVLVQIVPLSDPD